MAVSYTCPNLECGVTIKSPSRVAAGKSVKCPKCGKPFVPERAEEAAAGAGTLKLVDETPAGPAKPGAAAAEPPKKAEPAPEAKKSPFLDDDESDESVKKGYGVIEETEEEKAEAEKNKPKFTEVQDKFKKSARGPAQGLLVMPSNLLVGEGLLTLIAGAFIFVYGMWPLVFNDAPPGEEELEEAVMFMIVGLVVFIWGGIVCLGASQMQELGSYPLAMTGAIMGVLPLLVGIFGIAMLRNPKVLAGFEEGEGGVEGESADEEKDEDDEEKDEEDEEDDDDEDDDDDGDDDDDDDEDDEEDRKKSGGKKPAKSPAKKVAGKASKKKRDDDDEDDE